MTPETIFWNRAHPTAFLPFFTPQSLFHNTGAFQSCSAVVQALKIQVMKINPLVIFRSDKPFKGSSSLWAEKGRLRCMIVPPLRVQLERESHVLLELVLGNLGQNTRFLPRSFQNSSERRATSSENVCCLVEAHTHPLSALHSAGWPR